LEKRFFKRVFILVLQDAGCSFLDTGY